MATCPLRGGGGGLFRAVAADRGYLREGGEIDFYFTGCVSQGGFGIVVFGMENNKINIKKLFVVPNFVLHYFPQ